MGRGGRGEEAEADVEVGWVAEGSGGGGSFLVSVL